MKKTRSDRPRLPPLVEREPLLRARASVRRNGSDPVRLPPSARRRVPLVELSLQPFTLEGELGESGDRAGALDVHVVRAAVGRADAQAGARMGARAPLLRRERSLGRDD